MTESNGLLFSVIIPTRERPDTLSYAIQTALDQRTSDVEVIVSDNYSQDETKDVVLKISDPRLRYINTGRRMSMCDNWEFALGHARGKFVIFIGDDDAIIPGALDRLAAVIEETSSLVYTWPTPWYFWPSDEVVTTVKASIPLVIPLTEVDLRKQPRFIVRMGGWRIEGHPNVYHSAVAVSILDDIRRASGRVFHSTMPDIFTSLAIPVYCLTAVNVGFSVSCPAVSAKSNGGARHVHDGKQVQNRFVAEYGDYRLHPSLYPEIPIIANLIPDVILTAVEAFPAFYGKQHFSYNAMWAHTVRAGSMFLYNIPWWQVIAERGRIRKYHSFNVPAYLFYLGLHLAARVRRVFLPKRDRRLYLEKLPSDIISFVNQVAEMQTKQLMARSVESTT